MTRKAQSVPLVLLSITLKASGLKTRLSVGVCNISCYDIRGFLFGNVPLKMPRRKKKC